MACECFDQERLARCRAVAGTLIPSHYERETYCRGEGKTRCPTYRLFQLRRAPLTEELYYSLWMPPVDAPRSQTDEELRAVG
jgi:hypothetical protein